jgi:hypothetical protein
MKMTKEGRNQKAHVPMSFDSTEHADTLCQKRAKPNNRNQGYIKVEECPVFF